MAQEQENNTDFQSTNTNVEQNASASICNEDELEFVELNIQVRDCRSNQTVNNARVHKLFIKDGGTDRIKQTFTRDLERKDTGDTAALVKSSMEVLKTLGFGTDTTIPNTNASYEANGAAWRKHYNDYWKEAVPDCDLSIESGRPSNEMMKYIVDHYNSHRATDANGILKIYIPKPLLEDEKTLTIEVGFHDFPIVLERVEGGNVSSILRNEEESAGTGFNVSWNGTQSTAWGGNFGWVVNNISGEEQQTSELKVSETITIKTDAQNNDFDDSVLSTFHDDTKHFVLFAMQWCQPVWDGIEDPDPDADNPVRSNDSVFVNMKQGDTWVRGLNMHIVSKHTAGSGPYYGIFDTLAPFPRAGRPHTGVDLYSGSAGNNSVFAVRAGQVKIHSGGGYGYRAYLLFGGIGDPCFHYAHLRLAATAENWVMAGKIIGTCGRSYQYTDSNGVYHEYFSNDEPSHLHLEFIQSVQGVTTPIAGTKVSFSQIVNIQSAPTGANAFLYQGNRLPLLLPCQCHYGSAQNVSQCRVGNGTNVEYTTCYAIQKYPYTNNRLLPNITDMVSTDIHPTTGLIRYICPHILGANANKRAQLRAKIKFMHINRDRFNPTIFPHENSENTVFNGFFTDRSNFSINGDTNNTSTIEALRELIRAYYYCNGDATLTERTLQNNNARINDEKIQAFINRYVNNTAISSNDDFSIIRDFYEWFTDTVDFSNMCWNAPL